MPGMNAMKALGYLLEKPREVFKRYWANKRDEGVPETMKEEFQEAFKAGLDTMRDLAEAYGAYVLIFHEENGPCQDTGNTPVSFKEWATTAESGRVLKGDDYRCPMATPPKHKGR